MDPRIVLNTLKMDPLASSFLLRDTDVLFRDLLDVFYFCKDSIC